MSGLVLFGFESLNTKNISLMINYIFGDEWKGGRVYNSQNHSLGIAC